MTTPVQLTSPYFDLSPLRERVQSLRPLLIFDQLHKQDINYVASFYDLVQRRCDYASHLFSAIIRHKGMTPPVLERPHFPVKVYKKGEVTTRLEKREDLDSLLKAVDDLFERMLTFQGLLDFSETEFIYQNKLLHCEEQNFNHYRNKIPELEALEAPAGREVCWKKPKPQRFDRIAHIRDHALYGDAEVQNILAPLLDTAQEVYDYYRKASYGLTAFNALFQHYQEIHTTHLGLIHAIKNSPNFHSDLHVATHLKKTFETSSFQQLHFHQKLNPYWGKKIYPVPSFASFEKRCGDYPTVYSAQKGAVRSHMEDRVLVETLTLTVNKKTLQAPLWAIMDGHGGAFAADHCQTYLIPFLNEALSQGEFTTANFCNAARATCLRLHNTFENISGTTLVFVTIVEGFIYTVSVGDCRALLLDKEKVTALNYESNTRYPYFREKAERYGASVTFYQKGWRIYGTLGLNVASSIGDKVDALFLTQVPAITKVPITPNSALILCSDGLSNVASDPQIHEVVRQSSSLQEAGRSLMHTALQSTSDNISLIVVALP